MASRRLNVALGAVLLAVLGVSGSTACAGSAYSPPVYEPPPKPPAAVEAHGAAVAAVGPANDCAHKSPLVGLTLSENASAPVEDGPSKFETLKWLFEQFPLAMQEKYCVFAEPNGAQAAANMDHECNDSNALDWRHTYDVLSAEDCRIVLRARDMVIGQQGSESCDERVVDFSKIDPASVKLVSTKQPNPELTAPDIWKVEGWELVIKDHEGGAFGTNDREMGGRMVKAVSRMAQLCGGKVAPF